MKKNNEFNLKILLIFLIFFVNNVCSLSFFQHFYKHKDKYLIGSIFIGIVYILHKSKKASAVEINVKNSGCNSQNEPNSQEQFGLIFKDNGELLYRDPYVYPDTVPSNVSTEEIINKGINLLSEDYKEDEIRYQNHFSKVDDLLTQQTWMHNLTTGESFIL